MPEGISLPIYRMNDSERLAIVSGHGHVANFVLPQLAKDRAKQRGISVFAGIGGVDPTKILAARSALKVATVHPPPVKQKPKPEVRGKGGG